MLQIGDVVTVKSSPGNPATITGVLHEKSETESDIELKDYTLF